MLECFEKFLVPSSEFHSCNALHSSIEPTLNHFVKKNRKILLGDIVNFFVQAQRPNVV